MSVAEGARLRDRGMAETEAADHSILNDGRDTALIDARIAELNASGVPWSANDLRAELTDVRKPLIGARVRAAARRREMTRVGYEPSTLASTKAHPIAVWVGVSPVDEYHAEMQRLRNEREALR